MENQSNFIVDNIVDNIDGKAKVWVYAISARKSANGIQHNWQPTKGLDQQTIHWIEIESLQVAVSLDTVDPTSPYETELAFEEYENALQEMCAVHDCLPIRFGTKMPLVQVYQLIRLGFSHYLEKLESCAGCCELSIRWAIPIPLLAQSSAKNSLSNSKGESVSSGTSYLMQKRDQSRFSCAADQIACETGAKLQKLYPDAIRKLVSSSRRLDARPIPAQAELGNNAVGFDHLDYFVVELSLLVLKDHVATLKNAIREERIADLQPVLLSGPWPVHSFV